MRPRVTESNQEAFDRGTVAGKIEQRLAGHDDHFRQINGSMARLADEMHQLVLAVQLLGAEAESRDKTVVITAAALKDAEQARRDKTEHAWSPLTRLSVAVGVLAGLIAVYAALKGLPR